jgi:hypothetical protein
MKKILVIVIALLVTFVFASAVFAYDDLITLETNPGTHEKGHIEGLGNIVYLTASNSYDKDSEKQELADDMTNLRIPLRVRYCPIDKLETFVMLPIVSMDMGGESESGIGDIWLGAKYSVLSENLLTIRCALNLGTGDDEKGLGNTGGFGIDVGALTEKSFTEKFSGRVQVGIRWMGEDSDTKLQPGMGVYASGGVGYAVIEKTYISGGLELITYGESKWDGKDVADSNVMELDLLVGATRIIMENFGGYIALDAPLTGTNAPADMGVIIGCWHAF